MVHHYMQLTLNRTIILPLRTSMSNISNKKLIAPLTNVLPIDVYYIFISASSRHSMSNINTVSRCKKAVSGMQTLFVDSRISEAVLTRSAERRRHEVEYCKCTHSSEEDSRQGYLLLFWLSSCMLSIVPRPSGPLEKQTIQPLLGQ